MTDATSTTARSTQVQLVRRPQGWPDDADFRTVEVEMPPLGDGEVRVANEFMSVDPYMRGRMNEGKSYIPPFELDETMTGGAVGRVVASRSDDLPVGTPVTHDLGWRTVAQGPARRFRPVQEVPGTALSVHLGVLGMTGLTAYVGLTAIAGIKEGDTVFVSGAAGAVGSTAGQLARLLGAGRVVGSAGGPEKGRLLTERYGYDAAIDYKAGPVAEQLATAAPDGVDLYFDNVGGDHLEAALGAMNRGGRAALCGAIAGYNAEEPVPGPRNMFRIITQGLTLKGFTLGDWSHLAGEFGEKMATWFAEGRVNHDETVVDGIENAVDAFRSMMRGGNVGKMVVRVGG